jgi:hypothetical protein
MRIERTAAPDLGQLRVRGGLELFLPRFFGRVPVQVDLVGECQPAKQEEYERRRAAGEPGRQWI